MSSFLVKRLCRHRYLRVSSVLSFTHGAVQRQDSTYDFNRIERQWMSTAEKEKESDLVRKFKELSKHPKNYSLEWEYYSRTIEQRLEELTGKSLAAVLHICKVSGNCEPHFIEAVVRRIEGRIARKGFNDVEIATIVQSMAHLLRTSKCKFPDSLRTEIPNVALALSEKLCNKERLAGITNRILANVMHGLGVIFRDEADPVGGNPRLKRCIEQFSTEICREHHLVGFTQQGLANIVYAYGCLRWRSDVVLLRLSREIINRICGFKSQEVANIVFALNKLDYRHEQLIITLGTEAVGAHLLTEFSEQELCNVVCGLTHLAVPSSFVDKLVPIMDRLLYEANSSLRLPKYRLHDIASLISSVAKWGQGTEMKPRFLMFAEKLVRKAVPLVETTGKPDQTLSTLMHGCVKLEVRNPGFLKKVNTVIVNRSQDLQDVWTVTLLLWGLSSLQYLSPEAFKALCNKLCDLRENGAQMKDINWVQLTQASQYVQHQPNEVHLDPRLRDLLEEAFNMSIEPELEFRLANNNFDVG